MIKRSEEERNLIFKLHIKIVKDEKHDYLYGTSMTTTREEYYH